MIDDREKALEILERAERELNVLYDYLEGRPLAPIVYLMQAALDSLRVSIKCHYNGDYSPWSSP